MKPQKTITRKYQFAVIATDVVIFTVKENQLQALLIKMKKAPFERRWAAPGGLVRPEESVDAAAERVLFEKTGLKKVYLEQLYAFGEVDRDPFGRVVSVSYFALMPYTDAIRTTEEYGGVEWFPVNRLPILAYDHKEIISKARKRLQAKLGYTNIVYSLLPESFTLSELQAIYEIILEKSLDKRNFRKKLLGLGLVKRTGKRRVGLPNRPADLYTFTKKSPEIIEIL